MFIDLTRTSDGRAYLRLVESVQTTSKSGKKIVAKKLIKHLGSLAQFDDGKPDYLKRLRQSFRDGEPLIAALEPYCKAPARKVIIRDGDAACIGHPKICSNLLLEKIIEELGIASTVATCKKDSNLQYDVYGFIKLLIFGRILEPSSKLATVRQNDDYYQPVLAKNHYNPDNIYDSLDFLAKHKDQLLRRINTRLSQKTSRQTDLIFYDVTNFYYETDQPDEDSYLLDEAANPVLDQDNRPQIIAKGLRKYGVSKEQRHLPIVQAGLFMDNNGFPIAIETFPGNTLDQLTLRPALERNIANLGLSRFILVADRGICNYKNIYSLKQAGNGYIISKSLLKSSQQEREWTYNPHGYIHQGTGFMYKSRIVTRRVKDEDGKMQSFQERIVVYWSEKFQKRAEAENQSFLNFLEKLRQAPDNFRITSLQARSLRRFFKDSCIDIRSGAELSIASLRPLLNQAAIDEYKKSLGYYQIISSELDMEPLEIIDKYHGLTQIEDQFREMKGSLATRPLFVRTKEHIEAHLLICLMALIVLRVIQKRILDSNLIAPNPDNYWSSGLNGKRIQKALREWKVEAFPGELHRFMDTDKPDLELILKAFNIELQPRFYTRSELKGIKTQTTIFP